MKVRKAVVAGMFYPGNKDELKTIILEFLNNIQPIRLEKELKALIVPHAGYVYSGQVAAYGYSLLKKFNKKKIILLGPSHTAPLNEIACDNNDYWETALGRVKVAENNFIKLEEAHLQEHCLEVQIPFLQYILKDFEILPLVAGNVNPKQYTQKIIDLFDKDLILIISSDLSHYHDYNTAVSIDRNTISAIQNLDYDKMEKEGDACGKIPILILLDIAKKQNWKCKLLQYKNSGDVAGNKAEVVGYASFAFF